MNEEETQKILEAAIANQEPLKVVSYLGDIDGRKFYKVEAAWGEVRDRQTQFVVPYDWEYVDFDQLMGPQWRSLHSHPRVWAAPDSVKHDHDREHEQQPQ